MLYLYCLLDVRTNTVSWSHWTCTKIRSATSTRTGLSGVSLIGNEAPTMHQSIVPLHISISVSATSPQSYFERLTLTTHPININVFYSSTTRSRMDHWTILLKGALSYTLRSSASAVAPRPVHFNSLVASLSCPFSITSLLSTSYSTAVIAPTHGCWCLIPSCLVLAVYCRRC